MLRGLIIPALFGFAVITYLVFQAVERFPSLLGPVVEMTAMRSVEGTVTRVRDGDTIEVQGVPIRLGSLDCAEADTIDGERATARMRTLVSNQVLTCHLNGRKSYDRAIGSCNLSDGRNLGSIMISEQYCHRFW